MTSSQRLYHAQMAEDTEALANKLTSRHTQAGTLAKKVVLWGDMEWSEMNRGVAELQKSFVRSDKKLELLQVWTRSHRRDLKREPTYQINVQEKGLLLLCFLWG